MKPQEYVGYKKQQGKWKMVIFWKQINKLSTDKNSEACSASKKGREKTEIWV